LKLIDVNLLVYATNRGDPRSPRAAEWFDTLMNSGERVALPWHTLLGFIRVSTNPRSQKAALSMDAALEFVEDWLEWESVWVPEPTPNHFPLIAELLRAVPRHKLVPDAHLAALAISHGLTLCSTDVDFRLFKGLRLVNPLE
jgi:toxin-antitoxin system PIN domain toxin